MIRKIVSLVLVCGLVFSLTACDNAKIPTDNSKVDTAENESIVFAGDYTEIDNSNDEAENDNDDKVAQSSSEEKKVSYQASQEQTVKQDTSKKQDTIIKQESQPELNQKPVSSESVSSDKKTQDNPKSSKKQTSTTSKDNAITSGVISRSKAKDIALKHAGVNQKDVFDLDIELDSDYKVWHYDIDFEVGNTDYEYEIDATTGKILLSKPKKDNNRVISSAATSSQTPQITRKEAESIVFKHAGLNKSEVRDYEIDFDDDDNRKFFEIDFKYQGFEYAYKVNAKTGKIANFEKEKD